VQTAERCLRILKSSNLGRATFIVLERSEQYDKSISTPENAPRLIDLIKAKESKFLRAFYYVVRDTLVAQDLDQANRLAFGKIRWKVVTLDGKVIDKSGTMSGGGNRVVRGAMSKAIVDDVRPEEVAQLDNIRHRNEKEWAECKQELKATEQQLEKNSADLPGLEQLKLELETDISTAEKQLINFEKRLKSLKYSIGV
jgi:structural maintenance of chromosome 4